MTKDIAKMLMGCLCKQPFADKVGGLVEIKTLKDKKKIPFSCDFCFDSCEGTKEYIEFVPDKDLKSMFYFENNNGTNLIEQRGCCNFIYESDFNLIGWINKKKLGYKDCNHSSVIINQIIKAFKCTDCIEATDPYKKVIISSIKENKKDPEIFTKYGWKDNFRFGNYDYFSLSIKVRVLTSMDCIEDYEIKDELIC